MQRCFKQKNRLGQRFWKQGNWNESGFARGHIKSIYDLLQSLREKFTANLSSEKRARHKAALKAGETAIFENDYDRAKSLFESATNENRHDALSYFYFSKCLSIFTDAYEALSTAISLDPMNSDFYYARSILCERVRNFDAFDDINEAINLNKLAKSNLIPEYYVQRGFLYLKLNANISAKEIIADFDIVVKNYPNDYQSFCARGKAYNEMRQVQHRERVCYIKNVAEDYIKAAELYCKGVPGERSLHQSIYAQLNSILASATLDELNLLSKNEIIELIVKITPYLSREDAYTLCRLAQTPGNPLNNRLAREETLFIVFKKEDVMPTLRDLAEHYKPNRSMKADPK